MKKKSNLFLSDSDKNNLVIPKPGSIVACRQRKWVVLPSDLQDIIRLRPLAGNEAEICGIFTALEKNIESADFPPPSSDFIQDLTAAKLLIDAARLSLRSGAGPFRCLGRLSLRPRPYQLVPLLMALRLETTRLLIADDVGIGKTIEAGLIARELYDRAEIKRIAVLCPPQLCDQWQKELKQKFNINAVVVRSGTVSKLEKGLPAGDHHIFSYYPHIIVSLDYAKSDRRRASFLVHCPDLVIVDEAHRASNSGKQSVQQRYQLVKKIADRPNQHLILLTATPHSGISESFLSLLGLLKPEFEQFDLDNLKEQQRKELARHFVQRRRADVRDWLGDETPFPDRLSKEHPYTLSKEYRDLFDRVYNFAKGLIDTTNDANLSYAQRRGRYWSALAIIRCVMSSPAAAIATLSRQVSKGENSDIAKELNEELNATYVYDATETEAVVDVVPSSVVEKQTYSDSQKRKLREFVKAAEKLKGSKDNKSKQLISLVKELLDDGYNPIVWCRYIATANYLAESLKNELEKKGSSKSKKTKQNIRVIAITGEQSEDEREIRIDELKEYPQRVAIATDCLSEGINLQEHFNAAIHYDLPWNPNRLEQREGRIDRYGQISSDVKCILLYGRDNPVDGAVLEVLIRKAVEIHKALGITVPVPMDSNTVQEAVFKSLFEGQERERQLTIFDLDTPGVNEVHESWERTVEKQKQNRTRFAQRAIKPEEVKRELIESDRILGSISDLERFVRNACQRLNSSLIPNKKGWELSNIPKCLVPVIGNRSLLITFNSPPPEGVEYVGRNHPIVEGLASYLLEESLEKSDNCTFHRDRKDEPTASRVGVTVTNAVNKPTTILLLRLRHLLKSRNSLDLLAEECLVKSFTGSPSNPNWLSLEESLSLLEKVEPTGDIDLKIKRNRIEILLSYIKKLDTFSEELELIAKERAEELLNSHRRVRTITQEKKLQVIPQLPMDILGIYYLQPDF